MRTIDLFAGCGGMTKGFNNAGFETVAAFEFWDVAVECYAQNYLHPVLQKDLSETSKVIPLIKSFNPEVIIGGPPCQDFSHAGKRIEADRANLTMSFAQIIDSIKPKAFVMENVDRIIDSYTYAKARETYKNAGYGLTALVFDASLCGIPQKRKRFFCIGVINEFDGFLKKSLIDKLSSIPTTLKDYFSTALDFEHYYRHPRNYSRRAVFSINEPSPTIRGVNRPVPKGYPGHPNDTAQLTGDIRCLTTLERALIQTFPADYKWTGSKTDMEQMIGNAVPVKLAEYVATNLKNHLDSNTNIFSNETSFLKWLVLTKGYNIRSARDVSSRIRRAIQIHPICDNLAYYIFKLEQAKDFAVLSSSVRSQIKKALLLNAEFSLAS